MHQDALTADGGYSLICGPWASFPPAGSGPGGATPVTTDMVPKSAPILRVHFQNFTLPDEAILLAYVTVRHRQASPMASPRGIVFEINGTTLPDSYTTETFFIPTVGLTIAALNSGTVTVDLLYHAIGDWIPVPLSDDEVSSSVEVDHVSLTVETDNPPASTKDFAAFDMIRIPEFGVK